MSALHSLVENAVTYSDNGSEVTVAVTVKPGWVEVAVADSGIGIPARDLERIFERFVRLDSAKPGHGLGLAIARRIAEQHHGDLTCDPTPIGASFTLSLPKEP